MRSAIPSRQRRAARGRAVRRTSGLAFACLAPVAVVSAFAAGSARADMTPAERFIADIAPAGAARAAFSRPADSAAPGVTEWQSVAFRGLTCSRCNSATQFCVVNPVRYEYACAQLGTVACVSASSTHWCRAGQACWAGNCR